VTYDSSQLSYEALVKFFFEIHDFTQKDGQGADRGEQYLSVIFYANDEEKVIAQGVIKILSDKGYEVATTPGKSSVFWPAEDYHQNYYAKTGGQPYCHLWRPIF